MGLPARAPLGSKDNPFPCLYAKELFANQLAVLNKGSKHGIFLMTTPEGATLLMGKFGDNNKFNKFQELVTLNTSSGQANMNCQVGKNKIRLVTFGQGFPSGIAVGSNGKVSWWPPLDDHK